MERFDEINERLRKCSLRAIFFSSITNPSTRFVNSLVYAGGGHRGGPAGDRRRPLPWGSSPAFSATPTSTPSPSTRSPAW